ncbi:hypothetical protein Mgra_00003258 [Meloidogyne graminicola]|uniref:TIL domain-containing protein n=1 Tax=Meloidogyne graminicola TaxID=189291 RepID=A0A8S9ZUB2_9BILA|nr:hypothetical protein Mgra_00003258 [Meloidogyne graminicola]
MPKCSQEQCSSGCFCRLPYVLLNISNPFNSPCVLPSECPKLPFTQDLDKWNNGGFFPFYSFSSSSNNNLIEKEQQQQQNNNNNNNNIEKKCKDPLKNFQNCGSACPVGCGKLLPTTSSSSNLILDDSCSATNCVPGCFCRIPYVLRDPNNLDSECIYPQLCPLQSFSLFSSSLTSSPEILTQKNIQQQQQQLIIKIDEEKEKCENNPKKEYLKCGSSCPLGCNNQLEKSFRFCSPCISGCFCKNGFIFKNSSEWKISDCVQPLECPKNENKNNSINLPIKLKAFQKNNEKDNLNIKCGEALALANLYTKEGEKIGRIIVRPEKNEIGINNKKIRLNGEFSSSSIPEIFDSFLFLSIHQYSDTIINGCEGVGQPIGLNLIYLNENNEKEIKIVGELPISRKEEENNNIKFDQLIEWNETIGYGTNPLIGHSVVLQQHKGLLINNYNKNYF